MRMHLRLGIQLYRLSLLVTLVTLLAQPGTARAQATVEAGASAAPDGSVASGESADAPSPAPAAASGALVSPDDQQTAALLAELSAAQPTELSVDTSEPSIRFYGFMDMGLQRVWGKIFDTGLGQSDALNFVLGNVNLYMDVTPSPDWRGLVEVRFTTFPNGSESLNTSTNQFTRYSTTIFDYTANSGFLTVDWGAIVLERAHIDWTPIDQFNIRVGYFLTPVGIYNVDHGSPTRIFNFTPTAITYGFTPERQTGVEFFGLFHLGSWELGYHAYVSNGRAVSVDFTDDKAFGGRVFLQTRRPVRLMLGTSFYYGKFQTVEKSIGLSNGNVGVVRKLTVEGTEMVGGADLSLDVGALRWRVEGTVNQTTYTEGKRPSYGGALRADAASLAIYSILAYQLPWLGLEPVAFVEFAHIPTPGIADKFLGIGTGLNLYITPSVIIRTSFIYAKDQEEGELDAYLAAGRLIISY
jgi:hypothetical protein